MGKIKGNVLTKGFSGSFGEDLVFRQVDNKTFFARKSVSTKAPSAEQVAIRNRFTEASIYASTAIVHPITLEDYTEMAKLQGFRTAYLAAVTDFLTEPEISGVITSHYTGAVGQMIVISPKTLYKVTAVDVTIVAADGSVLESGPAQHHFGKFRYLSTVANPVLAGSKLVLKARDRQGKEQTNEVVL